MPKPKADAVTIELNADGMQAFRSGTRPPDEVLKIMLSHKHAVRYPVSINPANKCCMMRCASRTARGRLPSAAWRGGATGGGGLPAVLYRSCPRLPYASCICTRLAALRSATGLHGAGPTSPCATPCRRTLRRRCFLSRRTQQRHPGQTCFSCTRACRLVVLAIPLASRLLMLLRYIRCRESCVLAGCGDWACGTC